MRQPLALLHQNFLFVTLVIGFVSLSLVLAPLEPRSLDTELIHRVFSLPPHEPLCGNFWFKRVSVPAWTDTPHCNIATSTDYHTFFMTSHLLRVVEVGTLSVRSEINEGSAKQSQSWGYSLRSIGVITFFSREKVYQRTIWKCGGTSRSIHPIIVVGTASLANSRAHRSRCKRA